MFTQYLFLMPVLCSSPNSPTKNLSFFPVFFLLVTITHVPASNWASVFQDKSDSDTWLVLGFVCLEGWWCILNNICFAYSKFTFDLTLHTNLINKLFWTVFLVLSTDILCCNSFLFYGFLFLASVQS
jgi:hypothetical protein